MSIFVIIASAGRREILGRALQHLDQQSRRPDRVVLSTPSEDDVPSFSSTKLKIDVVFGPRGLAVQRNTALAALARDQGHDIVTFFDDDFLPSTTYLATLEQLFSSNATYAVVHGNVIADGATNQGYTFEEGSALLAKAEAAPARPPQIADHAGAYGCNMSIRGEYLGNRRFDERLVLYGWQEDIDFTNPFRRQGRIISHSALEGVHLGVKLGRVSGVRLGYSQIVNPIYLVGKGTMPLRFAAKLMLRNLAANVARSVRPEPWVDRRGRFKGNLLALSHVVCGRIEPEYVLKL